MPEETAEQGEPLDIPKFARRCWDHYRTETQHNREAMEESLGFWVGGDLQWRDTEVNARKGKNRPYITINQCKPAVDQVENEARNNPPGPQAHPVGSGADKDGADILEGLIREYEWRSNGKTAYITSLRYALAGGEGCFEMSTDYADERSLSQEIVLKEVKDPARVFTDPNAVGSCREDAMWGGKIRTFTREQLLEAYPNVPLKILNRSFLDRGAGWMQDASGWKGDQSTINTWTGGATGKGPFYVCEFYRVIIKRTPGYEYSDNVFRFDGEPTPEGVTIKLDEAGDKIGRIVPRRTVKKYVLTALDVLDETEWYGTIIPFFWVLGPEIYIKGKLHRLSLITGAIGPQRGLNYAGASMLEITGGMTKAPWVGFMGQFDVQNAQGVNPWLATNNTMWAYMEVKPTFAVNPTTKEATLLPPPQRNTWEAPIERLLELATFFREQIKGATAVFFDPSIQSVKDAQSGAAIKALQTQTNVGTLNWQDNLHRAVGLSYQEAAVILPQILDGPRVVTIVRPDTKHEVAEINQEFPENEAIDATGKKRKKNSIALGRYSLRCVAGPSFLERNEEALKRIMEFLGIAPAVINAPGVAPAILRMIGEGNPEVESIADILTGNTGEDLTPEQMKAALQRMTQENGALKQGVQQLQQAIQSKLPEIEAKKIMSFFDNLTKITVAEITASKDVDRTQAQIESTELQTRLGMAHDTATAAEGREHDEKMQTEQQAAATASQTADHQQAQTLQDKAAAAAAAGEGAPQ